MKKVWIWIWVWTLMVALLGMASCAGMQTAKDKFCNPTDEQKAAASAAATFLETMASKVGGPVALAYTVAKGVFLLVKAGVCVDTSQLSDAVDTFDDAQQKSMIKDLRMAAPNIDSLRLDK